MATQLELTTKIVPALTIKTLNVAHVLAAGDKLKMELGEDKELDQTVPEGESWDVHAVYTIEVS